MKKICSKCKEEKDDSEFAKRKDRKSGLYSCCKICKNTYHSNKYLKDKTEDPISLWLYNNFHNVKYRANKDNILFLITKEDLKNSLLENNMKCIYCKKELNFNGTPINRMNSPTIDRIIPKLGYIKDNITICCYRCNAIKSDANFDELLNIGTVLKELLEKNTTNTYNLDKRNANQLLKL